MEAVDDYQAKIRGSFRADIGGIHHRRLKHGGKLMDAPAERDFLAFDPNK